MKKNLLISLALAFISSWFAPVVYGSDVTQQQSTLYPYKSMIEIQEEFISGSSSSGVIGTHGWFASGGVISFIPGEATAPGILRRDTSAVSGTVATLLLSGTQNQILMSIPGSYTWRVRLNNNDANTTIRCGVGNGFTVSPPGAGFYFEKADADTNWFAVSRQTAAETRTDTGVAVTTDWVTFNVKNLITSGSFSLNGGTPISISSNLPVSGVQPVCHIVNSAAASKVFDVDYFQMQIFKLGR